MSSSAAGWFVILLALVCANLPFVNQRLFALIPLRFVKKPLWIRAGELFAWYVGAGLAGFAVEAGLGNAFPQGWQFYAITGCMMLVFAFPGFTWQYLVKHRAA
ncbi:membrane protein [Burkholderiaceae bacterium 16]|nr:membrane protein [Burkholderiaceae bacterium 16]